MSHTPGPWEWRDVGKDTVLWGAHSDRPIVLDCVRQGMQGATFRVRDHARCVLYKAGAEELRRHPDGALIQAAPDLLAVLKALVADAEKACCPGARLTYYEAAKAAIARAEGVQEDP